MSDRDVKPSNLTEPHPALAITCHICNAKPGERCGSILDATRYLDIPHARRRSLAQLLANLSDARASAQQGTA